jgi:hypothetical protein
MALGSGNLKCTDKLIRSPRSLRALAFGLALFCCGSTAPLSAQSSPHGAGRTDTLRGTVVNSVTHEPINRALVLSPDNRFATMTDDRGHFEFRLPQSEAKEGGGFVSTSDLRALETSQRQNAKSIRPTALMARKTGFLSGNNGRDDEIQIGPAQQDLTLSLVPEAHIVGQVNIPGSDGSDRIEVGLYRRVVQEGRAHWDQAGTLTSRSHGEFRFAELPAGSYKLFTLELLDPDPLTSNPRGQLFGYPPVYYPAASDFATAAVIQLSPGETFQATLSPARREYYPVKLAFTNATASGPTGIQVWPQGHAGPGYSLGYNPRDESIEGLLPNGIYTVQATTYGPSAMTGISNITVGGAAVSGPAVTLVPSSSITVTVKEEFQHSESQPARTMTVGNSEPFTENPRRPGYLQVTLLPSEEFRSAPSASLRPPAGPDDDSLIIENVQPGRYRVHVDTSIGFPSSITSGGTDLQRQLLVVGLGGSPPPIEITVRDDGAEVEGTIEGMTGTDIRQAILTFGSQRSELLASIYFLPIAESGGQFRLTWVSPDGKFQLQQLPPGEYRVLAFDRQQPDLEYASDDVVRQYASKARVIRVVAGQKEQLRLPLIAAGE